MLKRELRTTYPTRARIATHPLRSMLKILQKKKCSSELGIFYFEVFICDHGRIQTYDRWSRNPVLYSAELRGLNLYY